MGIELTQTANINGKVISPLQVDKTLTKEYMCAEAKATGDAIFKATYISSLDELYKCMSVDTTLGPYNSRWVGRFTAIGESGQHGVLELTDVLNNKNVKVRRCKLNDVWGEWEYENPPMQIGVEYLTTERFNNKPVYRKAIDLGVLHYAESKEVLTGLSVEGITVIEHLGSLYTGDGFQAQLPYIETDGTVAVRYHIKNSGAVAINVLKDLDGAIYGLLYLKYILKS